MFRKISLTLLAAVLSLAATQAANVVVQSPDGKINFTLLVGKELKYQISYGKSLLVSPSTLGFELKEGYWGNNLTVGKVETKDDVEKYGLFVGKVSHVDSPYSQATVPLKEKSGLKREINIVIRAFNDGVAFRYVFPQQGAMDSLLVKNEVMELKLNSDPVSTVLPLKHFRTSHEGVYHVSKVAELPANALFDLPATFEYGNGNVMSVTEASMIDYPGMLLTVKGDRLTSRLSPRLDRPELSVVASLPHKSPWRTFMISDYIGNLVSSTILTSLCEGCKLDDTSWIKPGKTSLPWWSDSVCADSTFQWGNNFRTNAHYIDFLAENGIQYHWIYGYGDQTWFTHDGVTFGSVGSKADYTKPMGTLDMEKIAEYAASKGVGLMLWVEWKSFWNDIDRALDQFEKWGIKGLMVDYMDRDDQEMIKSQEIILQKAAKHHIFIQFHGASKPSGLSRTYPNELTREGTLNYETYKWERVPLVGGDHDLHIAFTRLLAGPADYHLGGFNAVPRAKFKPNNHTPAVTVSRCHMMAMYVAYESYLTELSGSPASYIGQEGLEFISKVPTIWDYTQVPAAKMNEYLVVARKFGGDWWLGGISGLKEKDVEIKLSFLGKGEWEATIYTDADDVSTNPNHLQKSVKTVTASDVLNVHMGTEGGCAMHFVKR